MRLIFTILIVSIFSQVAFSQAYKEVASELGVNHWYGIGSAGGGVSYYDFNKDGWDDLTFASQIGDSIHFYINNNGVFEAIPSYIENTCESKQILWVDYDNDGDSDLFISCRLDVNRLYQNDGKMNFTDVTEYIGLSLEKNRTYGAIWGDYDGDGWLDLYVTNKPNDLEPNTNKLFRNLGNGTFEDATEISKSGDPFKKPFCAAFVDLNNDNLPDIYIAQDKKAGNTFLRNEGDGTFADISLVSNSNLIMDGMCVATADYDNNGYLDIYISNIPDGNRLLKNNGDETFTEVAEASGVGYYGIGWGSNFLDYDNDGDLDLYVSGSQQGIGLVPSLMYTNDGQGAYEMIDVGFASDTVISFSNAVGDFNNDGFPDLAVNNFDEFQSAIWKNLGNNNNWIKIHLQGTISNRDAIGSFIIVYADNKSYMRYTHCGIGFLGQNSQYETVGIGTTNVIDSIRIQWPSGNVDLVKNIEINQTIKIIEGATSLPPHIDLIANNSICEGDAQILETGFYQSYLWNNGETSRSIEVSMSGIYTVTVKDYSGASATSSPINVTVLDQLVIEVSVLPSMGAEATGSVEVLVSGGAPPYTYIFNGNSFGEENKLTNLSSGQYIITVIDDNGCFYNETVEVPVVNSISIPNDIDLIVYPNPIGNEMIIDMSRVDYDQAKIKLFDLLGNEIELISQNQQGKLYINTKGIIPGIYYLQIKINNDTFGQSIIKH